MQRYVLEHYYGNDVWEVSYYNFRESMNGKPVLMTKAQTDIAHNNAMLDGASEKVYRIRGRHDPEIPDSIPGSL